MCTRDLDSTEETMCVEASKKFKETGGGDISKFMECMPENELGKKTKTNLKALRQEVEEKAFAKRLDKLKVPETKAKSLMVSSEGAKSRIATMRQAMEDS
jgi:hypothetical protein